MDKITSLLQHFWIDQILIIAAVMIFHEGCGDDKKSWNAFHHERGVVRSSRPAATRLYIIENLFGKFLFENLPDLGPVIDAAKRHFSVSMTYHIQIDRSYGFFNRKIRMVGVISRTEKPLLFSSPEGKNNGSLGLCMVEFHDPGDFHNNRCSRGIVVGAVHHLPQGIDSQMIHMRPDNHALIL